MRERKWTLRWQGVLLGTGIGTVALISACAGAAVLMARGTVGTEHLGLLAAGILTASGLAGGLAADLNGGGPAEAALAALGELVVLFALNAVLNGGQMEGIGVTMLALAGGSGAAALLCRGGRRGRRRRRKS